MRGRCCVTRGVGSTEVAKRQTGSLPAPDHVYPRNLTYSTVNAFDDAWPVAAEGSMSKGRYPKPPFLGRTYRKKSTSLEGALSFLEGDEPDHHR